MSNRRFFGPRRACFWAAILTASLWLTGCGSSSAPSLPVLAIATPSLSDGTVGAAYSQTIEAVSGTLPFSWSVSSGALPHNLMLGSTAGSLLTITGTPDMVQAASFTVRVTDANGQSASQSYVVNIHSTVAQTQSGAVQGVVVGDEIAFRGIPYAAPPIGDLRWKPPQPPLSWAGTRDASTYGNVCLQLDDNNQPFGMEDCLVLNIYMSTQPTHGQQQAVMVFIHGGSNTGGSTQNPIFDAAPLATQGVILVTVEYRLGILGFYASPLLAAEGNGSAGNYGLRDQIAALAWVQQNIAAFGGDPTHVMVFGESSGSYDVESILVSPLARGLFSAAGMESGAGVQGSVPTLATSEAVDAPIAQAVGCDTAADVLACLRAVPADTVTAVLSSLPAFRGLTMEPGALPVDAFDTVQQNGSPVPLLIGTTREEESAGTATDDPTANPPLTEAGYEAAVHAEFDPIQAGAGNQVLAFYPAADYDAPVYALIAAESDFYDITPVRNFARAAAGANRPAVWRYLYTHRYENDPTLNALRAFHGADVPFVFGDPQFIFGGPYTPSAAEVTFAGQMMGYWSRMAKTGNPNGSGATAWPQYNASTDSMLQLDDTPATLIEIDGYHNPQCDYFSTLP